MSSKVYKFAARVAKEDQHKLFDVMRLANRYRNRLVEIELERRNKTTEIICLFSEEAREAEEAVEALRQERQALWEKVKEHRIKTQSRHDRSFSEDFKDIDSRMKEAWDKRQATFKPLYKHPKIVGPLKTVSKSIKDAIKLARHESGLYWGIHVQMYTDLKNIGKGVPPRFKRFEGEGCTVVQFQREASSNFIPTWGLVVERNSRVTNLLQVDDPTTKGKNPWRQARIRIGSEGKKPLWLEFKVKLHRPIPEGAVIKFARLHNHKIGTDYKQSLQLVLDYDWDTKVATKGVVAVRPGWRIEADGVVAADVYGDDGYHDRLVLGNDLINAQRKVRDLQSIRDKNMDKAIDKLLKHLHSAPEWLQERCKYISRWRSQCRLAKVVIDWRSDRYAGDSRIFGEMEAWRKQDKHLFSWEAHQGKNIQNRRKYIYLKFAREMANRYATIVLPEIDYREFDKDKPAGCDDGEKKIGIEYRKLAAVSILTSALSNACPNVVKVSAAGMSKTCGYCLSDAPCDCGVPAAEGRCLNLLRRYWENDQAALSRFFKSRAFTKSMRMWLKMSEETEKEELCSKT